ncbi:hypothetical protein [Achromobacter insuavis]|nr:hypothetical protein [Achromobacter insuavis]
MPGALSSRTRSGIPRNDNPHTAAAAGAAKKIDIFPKLNRSLS